MEEIMHLQEGALLHGRATDSQPWWCYLWPPACETSTKGGGGSTPSSTKKTTSTSTKPPTSTIPKTSVPPPTTAPPPAAQPATTPPAAAAQTPETSQAPEPAAAQAAPSPSPTTEPPAQMAQAVTSTAEPGPAKLSSTLVPVVVQPGDSSTDNRGNGAASPTPTPGAQNGNQVPGQTATEGLGQPAQSSTPSAPNPSATSGPGTTGIAGGSSGTGASAASGATGSSGGGLPSGAIAGIVIGLLLLLALLALLLYRLRRTPAVQRMLAPFSKLAGGGGGFHRVETPGIDGMGRNLLSPTPAVAAPASASAAAAGGMAYGGSRGLTAPSPQHPAMAQAQTNHHLHPLVVPAAVARRDSNRVSVVTNDSAASSTGGAFTPSPVSPISPYTNLLSPGGGAAQISRVPVPPAAGNSHHVSRGSASSISAASAISAGLAPGQMAWPMPPSSSQYISFDQSGETVVRINTPASRNRRSGGY